MKDLSNEKKHYETPQLTVVSFKTERCYAASGDLTGPNSIIIGEWFSESASAGTYVDRNDYGAANTDSWL